MTPCQAIVAFTVAAGLLTITPGLDTALVLRTAANEGSRKAMLAGSGICLGCLVWGFSAAIGVAALLAASSVLYRALRVAGAIYISYLGIRIFFEAGRRFETALNSACRMETERPAWFLRGLLTNLLNPKVGVFYVAFLPQFVPAGIPAAPFSMLLATIHATEGLLWFLLLTATTESLLRGLGRQSVSRTLDRGVGALFMIAGIVLGVAALR